MVLVAEPLGIAHATAAHATAAHATAAIVGSPCFATVPSPNGIPTGTRRRLFFGGVMQPSRRENDGMLARAGLPRPRKTRRCRLNFCAIMTRRARLIPMLCAKLEVLQQAFDWLQPPNRNAYRPGGTGTGFVLEKDPSSYTKPRARRLSSPPSTSSRAQRIRVTFSGTVSDAKLVGGNVDMDIAVLVAVRDPTTSLREGDSDRLSKNDSVTAYGFPLGAPQLQTTKGIISARIAGPSRLQADVLVNPGNSGGPLLDDAKQTVVGVITSGVDHQVAVGINYAAPIREAMLAVRRILDAWGMGASPCKIGSPSWG